ncbi:DEAD/DEAH box helicase [Polyangium sp. 15x6]|uniref:DEAD/DEAH box helicase n=1 Tax=Polyangium sp. 15x6 TaxID=3042687 RepID=UPI00249BDBEA|nr:DEAD/DEAH box helicase [Polyangium sp. 15x6]MDI3290218.1 DEAD/DEAH box helicase [Polyangium sp. 15x6]
MDSLLQAVRKACPPGLWSKGVNLARDGAVILDRRTATELTYRIRVPGVAIAPTVTLYVADEEWTCDCGGKFDPCQHVAAAVIVAAQSPEGQAPATGTDVGSRAAPAPKPALGKFEYEFSRDAGTLFLERAVVFPDGRREPFQGSITNRVSRGDLPVLPTHEDITIDRMFSTWKGGVVPLSRVRELFSLLENAPSVLFDGFPVRTSKQAVRPSAAVIDGKNGGVLVRVEKDPSVDEVIARGAARTGDVLRPLGDTSITGDAWEKLPMERLVAKEELGTFVTKILPDLDKHTRLVVRTRRLPGVARKSRPRISIELSQAGHTLSVLPLLVYGDPPEARVDQNVLVHLGGTVPVRDEAEERRLIERLRDELNLIPGRRVDLDGEAALRFAQKLKGFRGGEQGETLGELFGKRPLVPRFDVQGDSFDVVFESFAEDGEEGGTTKHASGAAVIRAWKDGLDIVPLEGGGFAPLPSDWLSRFGDRVADLLAARAETEDQTIPPALLPALARLCEEIEAPRPPGFSRLAPLLEGFSGIPESPLPAGLAATLRSYQRRGVDWLSFLRDTGLGGILADDMGLGKTLQALAATRGRALVVCPKSVLFNWEAEIRKFRPNLSAALYHGPKRVLDPKADVTLTTYSMLRIDIDALSAIEWDTVILDEAQAIKNPDSQVARAAYALRGKFKVALSGTPVENRLEELWSQMHFANRGLLGGRSDFKERYAGPIEIGHAGAAERLRERIRPFVLRRLKREVAPELPPRTDRVLSVELDDKERAVYDAVRAATLSDVVKRLAEGGSVLAALEALLRLRQAACHAALVPGQVALGSSKVEALVEALSDAAADGHKALVFSQWTSLLDLVEPHLAEAGISFNRLDGSTVDRAGVVNEFQADGGPPVMLLSLKAGGTGLNLTAADHVFLLDPWWNPAVEDQAADRAHRIGQDKPVFVYRLVAKDTVEERILALQEKKRLVADAALGEAAQAAAITRDDLMALLS